MYKKAEQSVYSINLLFNASKEGIEVGENYALELKQITKRFGSVLANDHVDLTLRKSEILAILGENGSGKTTLMNMIYGIYYPDEGHILVDGKEVTIRSPKDSHALGIGMVHQHFKLVDVLTAAENIVLGLPGKAMLNMKKITEEIQVLVNKYGFDLDLSQKIYEMSVSQKQTVEIVKMLYRGARILILDEPTAVLTPQEIDELIKVMKNLAAEGKSILFITHKLNEIKEAANRCTVLRKGRYVGTIDVASTTKEEMSEMMVGRKVNLQIDKGDYNPGECVLAVEDLSVKNHFTGKLSVNHVSFDVKAGEIVCIAGIDGNGQSELVYALTGLTPTESGSIHLKGQDFTHMSIRERNTHGLGHIPEDRHKHGLVLDYDLAYNTVLQSYFEKKFQNHGFLKEREIYSYADGLIQSFDIRCGQGGKTISRSMSGGNQQKIIIAREIDRNPDLLIAVQPTRGLDVGAIEYIHKQLVAQKKAGKGVLLVSLELDEVMSISDRILVMYEGEIVADLKPEDVTVQELGLYMAGSKRRA